MYEIALRSALRVYDAPTRAARPTPRRIGWTLPIAGAFQIFDGTQAAGCGVLRSLVLWIRAREPAVDRRALLEALDLVLRRVGE